MYSILNKLLNKTEILNIAENIVYTNEDGSYTLYLDYVVEPVNNRYIASKIKTHTKYTFSTLKSALCWAIMDKRNLVIEANRVIELDTLLEGASAGLDYYGEKIKKVKDIETKSLFIIKMNECRVRKAQLIAELEEIAKSTRKWQYKKFEALK